MQAPPEQYQNAPRRKSTSTWIWVVVGVLVVCGCGGVGVLGAVLLPVFLQARNSARRTICISNVKQLDLAQLMYSSDFDDKLPAAKSWIDLTQSYAKSDRAYTCPAIRRQGSQYGYAVSTITAGQKTSSIKDPFTAINLFETAHLVRNASGNPASESTTNRHGTGRTEGFVDGHVKWTNPGDSDATAK